MIRVRTFLEHVWRWLGEDTKLVYLLASFLVIHGFIFVLPQAPVDQADTLAFARWLTERYADLGPFAQLLADLGLFSLRTSLWMRIFLTILLLVVAVRMTKLMETWETLPAYRRWVSLGIGLGAVCFSLGWGIQTLWGWTESDLIAWPDTEIVIAERGLRLPPTAGGLRLWNGKYGLYLIPEGEGRGVEVQAFDVTGKALLLSRSTRSAEQTLLRIAVTSQQPESYFALSEADIIVRINQVHAASNVPLKVEVYRSAVGEVLADLNLSAEQDLSLDEHGVRLHFAPYVLPQVSAIFNPGAPFQVLGALLFVVGVILTVWQQGDGVEKSAEASDAA